MSGAITISQCGREAALVAMQRPCGHDTSCGPSGFAAGTAILTTDGDVLVEHLAPGDTAILAGGATARIQSVIRRRFDLSRHQRGESVRPVRIQRGALGDGLPARQLTLAPDQALLIGNALVQAKNLLDNATIFQDRAVAAIEYFQIEFLTQAILLAGGAAAESRPPAGRGETSVAPVCQSGPTLTAIRARLAARLENLGLTAVETLALSARAAGRALTPAVNTRSEIIFSIPQGAQDLLITTPLFTPADFDPASTDRRQVGLALAAIIIDGAPAAPKSLAASGLHRRPGADPHAWTTGPLRLTLPAGTRRVDLRISARPKTWHFKARAA